MKIYYNITENGKKALQKYPWLKSNYPLEKVGSLDDREITRLLENTHYSSIVKILKQIDKYGCVSDEIGKTILTCKNRMGLPRLLAELNLFVHLYENILKVTPIRTTKTTTPDFLIEIEDYKVLIEVFTPMEYYGYQTFSSLLITCIKNLPIKLGFSLLIHYEAKACEFPEEKEVFKWLDENMSVLSDWLKTANVNDYLELTTISGCVELKICLKTKYNNSDNRKITFGRSANAIDTRLYFEIDDSAKFAKTDLGNKIKCKLDKQQAGTPYEKIIRILAINFGLGTASDLSFLNEDKYETNFKEYIKYIASSITPYPPYDIVLPCDLSHECGFARPINLSNFNDVFINGILSNIKLNTPIMGIPVAPKEEAEVIRNSIKEQIKEDF